MVVATQNPIDMDGTYRLPEAQLDRFLLRLSMGYPDRDAELRVLRGEREGMSPDGLKPVLSLAQLQQVIDAVHAVRVDDVVAGYVVDLVAATREHIEVRLGASPRGSLALVKASRAYAAAEGRAFITPDDVKAVAVPVLAHRLILTPEAEIRGRSAAGVVEQVLGSVRVPTANAAGVGL